MTTRTRRQRIWPYLAAAVGGFVLAWAIVAFVVFPPGAPPAVEKLPNVIGLTFDAANQRLQLAGFNAQRGELRFQDAAPRSTVVQMTPNSGSQEPLGSSVILDLSAGPRTSVIPDVLGLAQQQADSALTAGGFTTNVDSTPQGSDQPRGTVIEMYPAAGVRSTVPAPVSLVLSAGPATVSVPDLAGRTIVEARVLLEQLGLTLGDVTILNGGGGEPLAAVVRQDPAAGTLVPAGARITVSVSGGRTP
ncbi:MAG TPA: PASTA domain-containing protein [Gemmatimonadaceae bacterium]